MTDFDFGFKIDDGEDLTKCDCWKFRVNTKTKGTAAAVLLDSSDSDGIDEDYEEEDEKKDLCENVDWNLLFGQDMFDDILENVKCPDWKVFNSNYKHFVDFAVYRK